MAKKRLEIGVCDLCQGDIPKARWYTSKGTPRLYCSRNCMNTANSRAGTPLRSMKARQRIARGEWQNPAHLNPPDPANISRGVSQARWREVAAGRWRNPALSVEARAKLSRPRQHSGALHRAIEKLGQGLKMAGLTAEEQQAYRTYRAQLRAARRDELNAGARRRYRQRQAALTAEEREEQRAKWRAANRRRKKQQEEQKQ